MKIHLHDSVVMIVFVTVLTALITLFPAPQHWFQGVLMFALSGTIASQCAAWFDKWWDK